MNKAPVADLLHLDERKLPAMVFEQLAQRVDFTDRLREQNEEAFENFGKRGREPKTVGSTLNAMFSGEGWMQKLDVGALYGNWPQIAGPDIAAHSRIVRVEEGTLTIRADSPAWQQLLHSMETQFVEALRTAVPHLNIEHVVVLGGLQQRRQSRYSLRFS